MTLRPAATLALLLLAAASGVTDDARLPGTAIVTTDGKEYTLPIECRDPARAAAGVSTEPGRITRERTGRSSLIRLTLRPFKDTGSWVVSLDRYLAWVPISGGEGGQLELVLDMSPSSSVVDGIPKLLTFDDWQSGRQPEGLVAVRIQIDCDTHDEEAPAFRKL